jgi:hypothetical protein
MHSDGMRSATDERLLFPVGAVVNGSVDLGTISFFASNCIGVITGYRPSDLTWKHNGSGFIYVGIPDSGFDDNIYFHDLASGTETRLTYF